MGALKTLATGAALLALAGCQGARQGGAAGGGAGLCAPFAPTAQTTSTAGAAATAPPMAAADPASGLEDCLHRWGYALAASSDDAGHVAQAVMAACSSTLAR